MSNHLNNKRCWVYIYRSIISSPLFFPGGREPAASDARLRAGHRPRIREEPHVETQTDVRSFFEKLRLLIIKKLTRQR